MIKVFSLVIMLNGQVFEASDSWLSVEDCVSAGLAHENQTQGIEWVCEDLTIPEFGEYLSAPMQITWIGSNYIPPAD